MSAQNVLLVGAPGSGKGTQALKLVHQKKWVHLSTGELFRNHINQKTNLGLIEKSYIQRGQ
ncbi:MAG: nucleoside monophosphate kinase [Oligoflexia bacterium]|nr:nucleoside monophosphate kinase [Oligoflexia bacterium]